MSWSFSRNVVAVAGATFVGLGLLYAVNPLAVEFAGVTASSPTGLSDLRAVYGGVSLGLGGWLLHRAVTARELRAASLLAALVCAGLASTRTLGLAVDGVTGLSASFAAFEALGAIVGAMAWRRATEG